MKNCIKKIAIILLLTFVLFQNVSIADVGSFESYGGGSSSSSGSSSGRDSYSGDGELSIWIDIIGIVVVLFIFAKEKAHPIRENPEIRRGNSEEEIARKIKEHDELFSKTEIIAWSKHLFVKLQKAWSKNDWNEIRPFETNELFEQHKSQLQGYIDNNQINVMDDIFVNFAVLYDYRISGDKEILVIKLNSTMKDYIVDATTKKILRGNCKIGLTNSYLLTFERKFGVKTKSGALDFNITDCPNCGAPTKITSSGECEYCGSIVTTGEYNWCLSNLERV